MSPDQYTSQDPTRQYGSPDTDGDQIDYPGQTGAMHDKPDHGENSYRGSHRLDDRAAVITGGDSGIGRAVALAFAREGADVVISYLEDEEADAAEAAQAVEDSGRKAVRVPGDVAEEAQCQQLIQRAVDEFGRIDVLVNNAAHQMTVDGIADVSTELLDRTFKTNIYAMFWLVKAALPHMPEGGSIINVGSIQAYQPSPTILDYASTKGAIVTFTKGLAQHLIERGIRVNAVAPGPVWTPLVAQSFDREKLQEFGKNYPMERPAQPAELAPAYVFLACDESRYVNGEVLGVTGGQPLP